jgi:hypothetical protein
MFYSYNNNQHFCYSRRYLFLQRHRYKQDKNVTFIWEILPVSLGNFAACFPPINTRPKLPRLDTKLNLIERERHSEARVKQSCALTFMIPLLHRI